MKTGNRTVERRLGDAASKRRWLRFLQHSGTLGSLTTLFFLLLALGMVKGIVTSTPFATALIALMLVATAVTWVVLAIIVISTGEDRKWLANLVERGQPELLDRVNTLVALEQKRAMPSVAPFYVRVAAQAQRVLSKEPKAIPLSPRRALLHLGIFAGLLAGTLAIYDRFDPWQRVREAQQAKTPHAVPAPLPAAAQTLELAPKNDTVEQKLTWCEVRITEPARDLQVTKVDVVPMQIEAAANETLQRIAWNSTINGASEFLHELPAPSEPRYAVYQPTLYLDELRLSDWDVLTYYAKASTAASNAYASDVYFIEVRPFREDILKMPGGENGAAMRSLLELSSLIAQQQHVIRQTHQHLQNPPDLPRIREQDRNKLAEAEGDLSKATGHLYAEMATTMENKPIGEALNHLAKAEKSLETASQDLQQDRLPDGQRQERAALADLAAARKAFQTAVSANPKDFEEPKADEAPPATGRNPVKEVAEFRNEEKAAQDFMRQLQQKQAALARRTPAAPSAVSTNLAPEQKQLQQSLSEFKQQHPKVFRPVESECLNAGQSMERAAQALQKRDRSAKASAQQASEDLQKLAEAIKESSADRQMTDAYKLKQALDQQIEKLGQCQNPGPGGTPTFAETRDAASDAKSTLKQLKQMAEQPPTRDEFGPELREALSEMNMTSMNWPLSELEKPLLPEARQKAAGQAKEGLEKVSKAFACSEPQSLQTARKAGQAGQQKGDLQRGMDELQSLIKQKEDQRPLSPEDQAKQNAETLYNLQSALREAGGSNERGREILARLEEQLKSKKPGESPEDLQVLKKLMEELQSFSVETAGRRDPREATPEVSSLDPSQLPPAYRGRIEKYFQKLSEK